MENNLDKLYQQKLGTQANREFEWQDAYWNQMDTLIEENAGKRRKRIWFSIFSWVGILAAFLFFLFTSPFIGKDLNGIFQSNFNSEFEKNIGKNSQIKNNLKQEITGKTADLSSNKTADFENIATNSLNNSEIKKEQTIGKVDIKENNSLISQTNKTNSESTDYNETNDKQPAKNSNLNPIPFSQNFNLSENKIQNSQNEKISNEENDIKEKSIENNIENILSKVTVTISLLSPKSIFITNQFLSDESLNAEPQIPEKKNRFSVALAAGYQFGINESGIENEIKSWRGGLEFGYQIAPDWRVNSGIFYRGFQSDFENSDSVSQINYAFARTEDEFFLQTKSLHYLEVPLNIGYQFKRSQFRFGLNTNYLIAARGNLIQEEEILPSERTETENADFKAEIIARQLAGASTDDLKFTKLIDVGTGWISTKEIDKWQINLAAEYRLLVFRNLHFGVGLELPINQINIFKRSNLRLNFVASYQF